MKVILVMVSSVDGKITRWDRDDVYQWTSREDTEYFREVIKKNNVIVMGSKTFDVVYPKPEKGKLRVVMTRNPSKYAAMMVPGQLEFTDQSPMKIVSNFGKKRYKTMLLVGGANVNTTFFKAGLVDELWLTIEPRIFGKGKMIVEKESMDIKLELHKFKRLNTQGTILLKYKVLK